MEVILGKNVVMKFYKEGEFRAYACAEECAFEGDTELKSVKTLGDGTHARWRGQKTSYTISVSGLIPIDEPNFVTATDLLDYWKNMVDIKFEMAFDKSDGSAYYAISGQALVTKPTITGPMDFAGGSFIMQGNGEPLFGLPPTCDITIFNFVLTPPSIGFNYHAAVMGEFNGPAVRYDWSLDQPDTPVNTALSTGWFVNVISEVGSGNATGPHTLYIWPVCANGVYGNRYEHNFTVTP